jgi:dienelactone hydrolase
VNHVAISVLATALAAGLAPAAAADDSFAAGEAVARVQTAIDPHQSYALYLPPGYRADSPTPILYCFEPRSRGMLCLDLFRTGAERLGYIIASSNNSRSDGPMEPNIAAMKAMWHDTHERFAVDDNRVYATGFSGGARVATIMGRVLEIAGVIAVGGGFPPSTPPDDTVPFDFYGLVGEHDFNYYELCALDERLDELGIAHQIDVFPGKHQWAPAADCYTALKWMELRAMSRGLREPDPAAIERWWRGALAFAVWLEENGEPVRAWRSYLSMTQTFDGLRDVSAATEAAARIAGTKEFKRQRKEMKKWDAWGQTYLEGLGDALTRLRDGNGPAPSAERLLGELQIHALVKTAADQPDSEEGRAAARVLEMVRVQTAFTQVQHYFSVQDYRRAATCLEIATAIVPDDPTVWYNLACAQARNGEEKQAIQSLTRAFERGFSDPDQARTDPDLDSLHDNPGFTALLE